LTPSSFEVGLFAGAQSAYLGVGLPAYGVGYGLGYGLGYGGLIASGSPGSPAGLLGYRAEAGGEGGAVHEVPGLLPSAAVLKQVSAEGGAVQTTGVAAGVVLGYPAYGHAIGKREAEAEADPSYLVGIGGYGYGGYGYGGYGLGLPIVHAHTVAVGGSVPVAVGGYVAQAGEGGAKHVVPGLIPALATVTQESEGGVSLSTGSNAAIIYG